MPLPWLILSGVAAAAAGWLALKERARIEDLESQEDPTNPALWEARARAARLTEDWEVVADSLLKLAELARGADRITYLLAAARLYEDRLQDANRAITCYEDALAENPQDAEAREGLKFLQG